MDDGLDFSELTKYREKLLEAKELFPKEVDGFLKGECKKIAAKAKKIAKNQVKTGTSTHKNYNAAKSYHKKFKTGKLYDYNGDRSCRAYNGSPHGHLIEKGHKNKDGTFTAGKHIFQQAEVQHSAELDNNAEEFLLNFYDKSELA